MAERDVELGPVDTAGTRSPVTEHSTSARRVRPRDIFAIDKSKLSPAQQHRLETWGDAIQPHTREGGDAYYIGDAYAGIDSKCASEWQLAK